MPIDPATTAIRQRAEAIAFRWLADGDHGRQAATEIEREMREVRREAVEEAAKAVDKMAGKARDGWRQTLSADWANASHICEHIVIDLRKLAEDTKP